MKKITAEELDREINKLKQTSESHMIEKDLILSGNVLKLKLYPSEWIKLLEEQMTMLLKKEGF